MNVKSILFILGSTLLIVVSWKALHNPRSHGFHRFFVWEGILGLFLLNLEYWFVEPFSVHQIIAWILLILSIPLVVGSILQLKRTGRRDPNRQEAELIQFEKTSRLVTSGLYRTIRHPLYSSLLFLNWGIFFKHFSWPGLILAAGVTIFLYLTAKIEEKENIAYFGQEYRDYMKKSRMFIPFVF